MGQTAKLRFADDVTREIEVAPGTTLLKAALEAGVRLDHQCLSGTCGTCVCRLVRGAGTNQPGRSVSLLPGEVAEGYRLACSVMPTGDTEWLFDYPSTIADASTTARHVAAVEGLRKVSDSVFELSTRLMDSAASFLAGQYVRIKLPDGSARSISMSSAPQDLPDLRFLIRYLPGGALSEHLKTRCRPGDIFELEGPMGSFVLPSDAGPKIFVAGGTGLAPILSMLDHLRHAGTARFPLLLCFGVGREADFFYKQELELRQFWMPKLTLRLACDERVPTAADPSLRTGSVVSLLQPADIGPDSTAFLCGPPAMVAAASERLKALGLPAEKIVAERFNPS
jgi:NAD(P)H-flavin reductase/ferredoxin